MIASRNASSIENIHRPVMRSLRPILTRSRAIQLRMDLVGTRARNAVSRSVNCRLAMSIGTSPSGSGALLIGATLPMTGARCQTPNFRVCSRDQQSLVRFVRDCRRLAAVQRVAPSRAGGGRMPEQERHAAHDPRRAQGLAQPIATLGRCDRTRWTIEESPRHARRLSADFR